MKLLEEISAHYKLKYKIKDIQDLLKVLPNCPRDKKVIMCHGVFDVVHPGHIRHLIYAKSKGDILVVSLTADMHILKGSVRPHVPENLRALNLAALEMVDYVIIDKEATPLNNIKLIKPDFFAKGYEYFKNETNSKTSEEKTIVEEYGGEMLYTPGDVVYSSSRFIETQPPNIKEEKLLNLMESEKINFSHLRDALASFSNTPIHVVGDTIIDTYTYCDMIGGMTKTPTMSLRYGKKIDFSGGAAIVAKHMQSAGAKVTFSTILGKDDYKNFLLNDLKNCGINCLPIIDELRPTTNKNVFIVGGYKVLKVDNLDNRSISEKILNKIKNQINTIKTDAVVFSDFRHGIFNYQTIEELISSIPDNVFKVADSQVASRWGNILDFKNFDLITPNEREARFSLGDQDSVIRHLAKNLYECSKVKTLILKLGPRGIIVFRDLPNNMNKSFFLDSFSENIIDAVGAGDALNSYSTLALLKTKNEVISAILGSFAAALECEYDGNIPITRKNMENFINKIEKKVFYRN